MPLCPNTYRRGSIFWWRRRFDDGSGASSREIALSLRTREPSTARWVGSTLNGRAYELALPLKAGEMTIADARDDLVHTIMDMTWTLTPEAAASLAQIAKAPRLRRPSGSLDHDQIVTVVGGMVHDFEESLIRQAAVNRTSSAFDGEGRPLDPEQQARIGELATATLYRAIATGGCKAKLDAATRERLESQVGRDSTAIIARDIASEAAHEGPNGDRWRLGPSRSDFERIVRQHGFDVDLEQLPLLRRYFLLSCAEVLEDDRRRPSADMVSAILSHAGQSRPTAQQVTEAKAESNLAICTSPIILAAKHDKTYQVPDAAAVHAGNRQKSLSEHVEDLIRTKRRPVDRSGKALPGSKGWDGKTADQHRSITRLLTKIAGTNEPNAIQQNVLAEYRLLLEDLPKNWGKSPADAALSLDTIKARAQDLEECEVGLAAGTINRHMTQLNNIVTYLKTCGYAVGEIHSSMRSDGAGQVRGTFTSDELRILFGGAVWTGCESISKRTTRGPLIVKDALYWIPILGRYQLLRLNEIAGLLVEDIDIRQLVMLIRNNSERSVKTAGSTRRQPLVPEVLRLGFLDYVKKIRDSSPEGGKALLFPCLRQRGDRTPLSNLFYKAFKKVLDQVLPGAATERKSFHSLRKDGNTIMANANVNDPIRHAVMGHAHSGVNEKHYLDAIYDDAKRLALVNIEIVTDHLG